MRSHSHPILLFVINYEILFPPLPLDIIRNYEWCNFNDAVSIDRDGLLTIDFYHLRNKKNSVILISIMDGEISFVTDTEISKQPDFASDLLMLFFNNCEAILRPKFNESAGNFSVNKVVRTKDQRCVTVKLSMGRKQSGKKCLWYEAYEDFRRLMITPTVEELIAMPFATTGLETELNFIQRVIETSSSNFRQLLDGGFTLQQLMELDDEVVFSSDIGTQEVQESYSTFNRVQEFNQQTEPPVLHPLHVQHPSHVPHPSAFMRDMPPTGFADSSFRQFARMQQHPYHRAPFHTTYPPEVQNNDIGINDFDWEAIFPKIAQDFGGDHISFDKTKRHGINRKGQFNLKLRPETVGKILKKEYRENNEYKIDSVDNYFYLAISQKIQSMVDSIIKKAKLDPNVKILDTGATEFSKYDSVSFQILVSFSSGNDAWLGNYNKFHKTLFDHLALQQGQQRISRPSNP